MSDQTNKRRQQLMSREVQKKGQDVKERKEGEKVVSEGVSVKVMS